MAFIHQQSCEGVKSELDLFAVPPTQTSIDEGQPMTSLDSGGPIEFVVPGTGDAYIDLANTYLFVRAKIIRGVGTNLADDTPVAPINTFSAKDGDLRLSASNACLPKTEISVFVTECVFFTSTCYKLHIFTLHYVPYS